MGPQHQKCVFLKNNNLRFFGPPNQDVVVLRLHTLSVTPKTYAQPRIFLQTYPFASYGCSFSIMNKANIFGNELEALHEKVLHKKHRSPPCFSFRDKSHFVCELKIPPFHSLHSQMSVATQMSGSESNIRKLSYIIAVPIKFVRIQFGKHARKRKKLNSEFGGKTYVSVRACIPASMRASMRVSAHASARGSVRACSSERASTHASECICACVCVCACVCACVNASQCCSSVAPQPLGEPYFQGSPTFQ